MEQNHATTPQLQFIGKVLSAFSHEINNHLAITKESVGLIGDFIECGKTSRKDLREILGIIDSIQNQIKKTSFFFDRLNGFSHGMEAPLSSFSVHGCLEDLIVLLQRLAYQKQVRLEKDFAANMPLIENSPFRLQFLIYCLIDMHIKRIDKNSSITIKTSWSNNSVQISVIPKGNEIKTEEEGICNDELYHSIAQQLGGSIVRDTTNAATTFLLPGSEPSVRCGSR
jgi:C4-dicarboxylate-specific signal transduction histidine kinase